MARNNGGSGMNPIMAPAFSAQLGKFQEQTFLSNQFAFRQAQGLGPFKILPPGYYPSITTTPQLVSFTRATVATDSDVAGVVQTADINVPRFDFNPVTHAALGLLVEAAATNLFLSSEDFRTAVPEGNPINAWGEFVDADTDVANLAKVTPNGGATSSKLRCTTIGIVQRQVSQPVAYADNTIMCASVFVCAAEVLFARLVGTTKVPAVPFALFDLTTGAISNVTGLVASGAIQYPGGWWRLWIAFDVGVGGSSPAISIQLKTAINGNYSGAIGDGFWIWGAMSEIYNGVGPSSYISTGAAAVTRAADVATIIQ